MAFFSKVDYWYAYKSAGLGLCAAAALILLAGSPARAEETTASATSDSLGEITVTARKLGSDLSTSAISVVTTSAKDMELEHIQTLQDVAVRVPNLVYNSPAGFAEAYIRGLGSNFTTAGLESSVATYVDGVYLQRQNGAVLGLVDLKSVDVLNGPQGTLYGRNATGGVILVETADPTNTFGGFVNAEYGNFNTDRLQAALNLPITDTLAIRLSVQQAHNGGYLYDVNTGGKRGEGDSYYGRLKVRWAPTEEFSLTYSVEGDHTNTTSFSQKELLAAPYCEVCALFPNAPTAVGRGFYTTTQENDLYNDNRFVAQTLGLRYTTSDFTVNSTTGLRNQQTPMQNSLDGLGVGFFQAGIKETGPTLTEDTFLRTTFRSPLNGLIGASYERERDNQETIFFGEALGPAVAHNSNGVAIDSYSIYGELNYDIGSGFKLAAGARYNNDKKEIAVTNDAVAIAALGLSGIPGADAFTKSIRFNSVTPRAVLSWDAGFGYYYASYNKGEKSGGFGSPLNNPNTEPAQQETLDSYELGAKNNFLDNHLHTTVAIFYGKYKDIQVSVVDPITDSISLQNAASATVKGAEFNARFAVTPAFNVSIGGAYLDDVFTKFTNAEVYSPGIAGSSICPAPAFGLGLSSCRVDLSGTSLPRAPRWSGYVSSDYTQELASGWSVRLAGIVHTTSSYLFAAGGGGALDLDRTGGYTKVDSTLTAITPNKQTEIGLYANNMFEHHYYDYIASGGFGTYAVPGMPRTYGIRVSQKF